MTRERGEIELRTHAYRRDRHHRRPSSESTYATTAHAIHCPSLFIFTSNIDSGCQTLKISVNIGSLRRRRRRKGNCHCRLRSSDEATVAFDSLFSSSFAELNPKEYRRDYGCLDRLRCSHLRYLARARAEKGYAFSFADQRANVRFRTARGTKATLPSI